MVSNVAIQDLRRYSLPSDNKPKEPTAAEQFLDVVNKSVETKEKGSFGSKYMWSPTAALITDVPFIAYIIHSLVKMRKASKVDTIAGKAIASKFLKRLPFALVGTIIAQLGIEYLLSRNADKKYNKFKQDFASINTETGARLREKQIRSSYVGAVCSAVANEITINKNMVLDPILRRNLKKLTKHELVHAKQYATIARSKDGIKKLNYAVLCSSAKLMDTPNGISGIKKVYNDVINNKTGEYDNLTIHTTEADMNFKNYIIGIYTILTDKNASFDDVPMIIDEKYYQNIVKEKGELSAEEEEEKANEYYQAMLDYPKVNFWSTINPFSSYYSNTLEREAYKENPNFATFINKLFKR